MLELTGAGEGDLVCIVADREDRANVALDGLRRDLAARLDLIPDDAWAFCWMVDPPLFEYSDDEERWVSMHHPFTSPASEDLAPETATARAYDLVLNGFEIGGGSIRIHDAATQRKVFAALQLATDDVEEQFGHLLRALALGAPPHGGIAMGVDRLVMILAGKDAIRDVIAFPKSQSGTDPLTGAPASVDEAQLRELGLELTVDPARRAGGLTRGRRAPRGAHAPPVVRGVRRSRAPRRGRPGAHAHPVARVAALDDPVGPCRHRQDDARPPAGRRGRRRPDAALRRELRRGRRPQGHGGRPRRAVPHGAVRRRGASMVEGPAGRAAARGGGGHRDPDRRHHREPLLLAQLAAAVPVSVAAARAARRRRGGHAAVAGRSATTTVASAGRGSRSIRMRVDHLVTIAGGDARMALTGLEAAAEAAQAAGLAEITRDIAAEAVQKKAIVYDRQGDAHYDVISAFIKSIRGSDPDGALFWLARMIEAGEDPRFIARRLVVHASEDIGMADSTALLVAVAAAQAVEHVGLPEVRLNLAHATVYLATAPKSNSVYRAIGAAFEDAPSGEPVPLHLRDASYRGAKQLGPRRGLSLPARLPGPCRRPGLPADRCGGPAVLRAIGPGRRRPPRAGHRASSRGPRSRERPISAALRSSGRLGRFRRRRPLEARP